MNCVARFESRFTINLAIVSPVDRNFFLTKTGTGDGDVALTDGSGGVLNCDISCEQINRSYPNGTSITLSAIPKPGSTVTEFNCEDNDAGIVCVVRFDSVAPHVLKITKMGAGLGTVISPAGLSIGINCDQNCLSGTAQYTEGTVLTLSAIPLAGSRFTSWGGSCQGASPTITVALNSALDCTAQFDLIPEIPVLLTLLKAGASGGTITATPETGAISSVNCGIGCFSANHQFARDSVITLHASSGVNAIFVSWIGDGCQSTSPTLSLTLNRSLQCTALFDLLVPHLLTIVKDGDGAGAVNLDPAGQSGGLRCDNNCTSATEFYPAGKDVPVGMTAVPQPGSSFAGWSGDEDCLDGQIVMNRSFNCIAAFIADPDLSCASINAAGGGIPTQTSCAGGISPFGGLPAKSALYSPTQVINLRAAMKIETAHINQTAESIVLLGYAPPQLSMGFFVFEQQVQIRPWSGNISHLFPYRSEVLQEHLSFDIYTGPLPSGQWKIYFGYRLTNGQLVFNTDAITALVGTQ